MRALGVALAVLVAGPAEAQEPPLSLMLTCQGTDVERQQTGTSTTVIAVPGTAPAIGSEEHKRAVVAATATTKTTTTPVFSDVRVPARISVAIEGNAIRVRPSNNTKPGFGGKKSPDGWYELTAVSVSDASFRGQAPYGGLFGKYKLEIDRLTGDVRFGGFSGVCERATTGPAERKF